jgi:CBS domain-containing protein
VPHDVTLGEVCSREPATLRAGDTVDDVVRVMRERAVRRLPVVEDGRPVGVVSLGDLATTRSGWRRRVTDPGYVAPDDDPALTLADIVEAPPST